MEGEGEVVLDCLAFLVQTPATTNRRKNVAAHSRGGKDEEGAYTTRNHANTTQQLHQRTNKKK